MLNLIKEKLIKFWQKDNSSNNLDFTDAMLGTGDIPVTITKDNKIIRGDLLKNNNIKQIINKEDEKDKEF